MFACMPFRNLEQIDRRSSGLQRFPEDAFRHHRKLKTLLLDGNPIKLIPRNITALTKLERLTLADCELVSVPAEVFRLSRLQELSLRNNGIGELPTALKGTLALLILDISSNSIGGIPDSIIDNLSHLTSLCINDCTLQHLPQELGGLKSLQVLEARDNRLKFLPQTISQLKQLRKLDVGCNDITDLPEGIGNLTRLEELWVDTNDMESLPVEVGALEQLKVADFSENHLESLPADLTGLANLTDLILSTNTILALPESIGSLKRLAQLKCENNHLTEIPESIGNLKNLKELFLTDNMLEKIPSSVGNLESLSTLYVDRNHLVSVPPELCLCKALTILSLRQNHITRIPPDFGLLSSLKVIDLCNNKLEHLPVSFLQLNLRALWLSDNQSKALMDLQEETDSVTKEVLLTCVLLPQATGQSQSLENLLQVGHGSSLMGSDTTSRASQMTGGSHEKPSRVAFAPETLEKTGETESENVVRLQRHPTPFAKDMRARANLGKHRRSPDSSKRSSSGSLAQSEAAATPPVARAEEEADKTEAKTTRVGFSEDIKNTPDGGAGSRLTASMRRDTPHPNSLTKEVAASNKSTEEGILDNNADEEHAVPSLKVSFEATAEAVGDKHVSFDASQENATVKEEKEDEVGEIEPTVASRLIRKDTPKPKQYSADESKLRRRDTPRSFGTPSFGKASPGTAVLEEDEEEEEAEMMQLAEEAESRKRDAPTPAVVEIQVMLNRKDGRSLGFSISGGVDCNPPYRSDNNYVYITRINPGGLAEEESQMRPGDRIVSVNGTDYSNGITHEQAVASLKSTAGEVIIVLSREQYDPDVNAPAINIIPASVEKSTAALEEDEDDVERRTDTPPTPEESKRQLSTEPVETLPEGMEIVRITRGDQSLGMTIVGGSDTSPLPFGTQQPDDQGVYISKTVPGGLVEATGRLSVGDEIISVNDEELNGALHSAAVASLVGSAVLKLVVRHVGAPPGIEEIEFEKAGDEKLGLSIRGGSGSAKSGNPFNDRDEGIFISKINPGGAAYRCGKFRVGQRILEVNGNTLLGATHHEAVHILKCVGRNVTFVVCDGYDPPDNELPSLEASMISNVMNGSTSEPLSPAQDPELPAEQQGSAPSQADTVEPPTQPAAEQLEAPAPVEPESEPSVEPESEPSVEQSAEPPVEPAATLEAPAPADAEPEPSAEPEIVPEPALEAAAGQAADKAPEKPPTPEVIISLPSEDQEDIEQRAEQKLTKEAAVEAEESPASNNPVEEPASAVAIGGHALRSTPVREARAEASAAAALGEEEQSGDGGDVDTPVGHPSAAAAAAASAGGDEPPTTPSKKKKHKKHKKKRHADGAEDGEGKEGKEHRHRRSHRKDDKPSE